MAVEMIKPYAVEKDSEDMENIDDSPSWCGLHGDQMTEGKTEL